MKLILLGIFLSINVFASVAEQGLDQDSELFRDLPSVVMNCDQFERSLQDFNRALPIELQLKYECIVVKEAKRWGIDISKVSLSFIDETQDRNLCSSSEIRYFEFIEPIRNTTIRPIRKYLGYTDTFDKILWSHGISVKRNFDSNPYRHPELVTLYRYPVCH